MDASEVLGAAVGTLVAPFFALTSSLRHARTFHPRGDLADATIAPHPDADAGDRELAERLSGRGLVRFSDALTKGKARWPDVLGCAIRFGADHDHLRGGDGEQDLLFATIRRPWTMPFAPFSTHVLDYLENDYFAVSPFSVPGRERVYFRLHPEHPARTDALPGDVEQQPRPVRRLLRLARSIANGTGDLVLGVAPGPYGPFRPLVRVHLVRVAEDHPRDLRFDPFHAGCGIHPRGFVHALRRSVYEASQRARARNEPATPAPVRT